MRHIGMGCLFQRKVFVVGYKSTEHDSRIAGMRLVMGSDGYADLVRLLGVIDRCRWDYVPANYHERIQGRW